MYPAPATYLGYEALHTPAPIEPELDLSFLSEAAAPPVASAPADFGYTPSIAEVVFGSAASIPFIHSDEHGTRPTVRGLKWIGAGAMMVGAMVGFTMFDNL